MLVQRSVSLVAGAAAAIVLALAAPLSASAVTVVVGNDVSWPQCGKPLPTGQRFGIVGVNDGLANTTNPCFSTEFAWASNSLPLSDQQKKPVAQLYVNTADPGKQGAWWPKSNSTIDYGPVPDNPYGTCTGRQDAACAYVYGYQMAMKDAVGRGVPSGGHQWWLDVETGNTWSKDTAANRADLEAMVAVLKDHGSVGIYSTSYQFGRIAGTVPGTSPLTGLPTWLAGAKDQSDAQTRCAGPSFTGGTNLLVQWVSGVDDNLSCID